MGPRHGTSGAWSLFLPAIVLAWGRRRKSTTCRGQNIPR
jgi:hypothetical protein